MHKYPNLFSPIEIAGKTFKNRILGSPALFGFYALGDTADRVYRMYEDKARGGQAEVVVGETPINYTDAAEVMIPGLDTDYTIKEGPNFEAYKKYADVIKKHDTIANIELFHGGVIKVPFGKPKSPPWGPVGYTRDDGVIIEAFDDEKMAKVCKDFATCADFMKAAGFDGIMIHGGHGYLFTQFLSPVINLRTDEYGGSIENRGRFPLAILKSIRDRVGKDFIVELRINGADMVEGGATVKDTAEFCSTLDGLVDLIHVSSGFHMDSYKTHTFSSHYDPHGVNVERAAYIKKRTKIPVTVVGGINDPEFAERIISEGKVDFVSLGRQLIADPEFANKVQNEREDEIRRCMRCYQCYGKMPGPGRNKDGAMKPPSFEIMNTLKKLLDGVLYCTINPRSNNELKIDAMPAPQCSRNVLVVGGGPGGMQAAITASDRGHNVTLFEKESILGGALRLTDADTHKVDLKNFKDLLVHEVGQRNINVLLDSEVTPEFVVESKPDALILAVGASASIPPIPGLHTAIHALEVYMNQDLEVGRKVVMLGGGLSGCETAIYLADKGHDVIIVEMFDRLAPEIAGMPFDATMDQLEKRKDITVRTGSRCIEITPEGVMVDDGSGNTQIIECDTVVHSLGMVAKRAETEILAAGIPEAIVFEVGDCVRGARVFEAVNEGFMAAMKIV